MKKLKDLTEGVEVLEISGNADVLVEAINFDSTKPAANSLFVSATGIENNGHNSISEALKNGAKAVVFEKNNDEEIPGIAYIKVKDGRKALGVMANNFYDNPSRKLKLVGVTGTNGKTTTATSLFKIFRALQHHVALVSTVENKIDDKSYSVTHTTPTPINLAAFLAEAVSAGVEYAFMECSSHGIEEERIAGLEFVGGIFTNLTQDHLDYHGNMEKYGEAKKKFFDRLPESAFALSNADDPKGKYMLSETKAKKYLYGIEAPADFSGRGLKSSLDGIEMEINGKMLKATLIGKFNAYNILGIYAAASLLGVPEDKLISIFKELTPPAGRLQFVKSSAGVYGIVDYAHTPDALENILKTLNEVKPDNGKIISLVGCGGDRDKFKRPIMGEIGSRLSDYVIFTSDNPRNEDPEAILKDLVAGVPQGSSNYDSIVDRATAIEKAVKMAQPGDIVVVAGKGHEDYQVFADKTIHFSDIEELNKWLK